MSVTQHDAEIQSDFIEGGYTAHCSCGWGGERCETMAEAMEEWEDHCEVVFIEATSGDDINTEAVNQ